MKTRLLLFFLFVIGFANSQVTSGLIQHFKFDNSYANVAGTTSFSATSFDFDRSGHPNSAVRMTFALQSQATIPSLPYGNAARTISFWTKSLADGGLAYGPVFSYGTGTTGNAFGGGVSIDRTMIVSHTDNFTVIMGSNPNSLAVWYHFVMTYDGTTAKMYRNGQLIGSMVKSWNTINNADIFRLGVGTGGEQYFNGLIDDLKIYNRAVTDTEARQIYNEPNSNSIGLIKSFSFNNSPADDTNSVSFTTSNAAFPITYIASRTGAGQAMVTTASATRTCTIPNLPLGKRDRTISFWYYHSTFNPITSFASFNYGGSSQYNTFGFYLDAANVNFQGFAYDQAFPNGTINPYEWYHAAIIFEGDVAKIMINGGLREIARPLLNTTLTAFKIGAFAGAVDDLQIYDRALSVAEVSALYSKPAVSVTSYPATFNSATINYTIGDYSLNTSSVVKYGVDSNNLSSQAIGFSTTGNGNRSGFVDITGLLPNTTYYFQVEATNSSGTGISPLLSFTTQSQAPGIFNVATSLTTDNSTSVDYSLWDKGLATTSIVRYGIVSTSLTNQVVGFSVSGNATVAGSVSLTGLSPNTTYFYQVEATNSAGTTTSTIASFTTTALPALLAEYTFDTTYNNVSGNTPFSSSTNTTFVNDRAGQTQKALRIGTSASFSCNAAITNIPVGNSARTVSIWYKTNTFTAGTPNIFNYGANASNQYFGHYVDTSGSIVFWSFGTDYSFGGTYAQNTWRHAVFTFDGANVKAYINGVYLGQRSYTLSTGNDFGFKLGGTAGTIEVDDLKIYNFALNQTQVSSLFNTNVLFTENFNQNNLKVALYPNPANDILNIETAEEIQNVEIYTLQGQKVITSNKNQIDVSGLSKGMYIVRVQDINNAIATQKLIVE